MKKRIEGIGLVIAMSFILGGCSLVAKPADMVQESPRKEIVGVISAKGDKTYIVSEGKNIDIFSRKVDLKLYDGKTVTVVGEYSGTTLFVDEVMTNSE